MAEPEDPESDGQSEANEPPSTEDMAGFLGDDWTGGLSSVE